MEGRISALSSHVHARKALRRASPGTDYHTPTVEALTYYSALGCNDDAYLAARAIQFFAPGVPQVYYVGLLAGQNDQKAVQETGEGRAINRHNYSVGEVDQAVQTPIVQRLLKLIHFRNGFPAFNGDFRVLGSNDSGLVLAWQKADKRCQLNVDLNTYQAVIAYTDGTGEMTEYKI